MQAQGTVDILSISFCSFPLCITFNITYFFTTWTCPECGARKEDFEMVQI